MKSMNNAVQQFILENVRNNITMNKNGKDEKGKLHKGRVLVTKDGYDVIECELCGLKHIIPLHKNTVQEEFYSEKFYQKETKNYIKRHQEDYEWWSIEHNEKYYYFEKYVDETNRRKILDIGSGPGFFLKIGKERGWDVTGIEPGKIAYEFAKHELGLNIVNEFFCEQNYLNFGLFDVVHLNNVLEHLVDPINILKMAIEITEQKGLICVTSPNDFNPLQKMAVENLSKDYWWVVPDHHVNYFDSKSLNKLFSNLRLNVIYETTSFPLELFLFMGDDYIGNDKIGRNIHKKRMTMEKHFSDAGENGFKRRIYNKLAEFGLGREITIIAKRKLD